MTGLEPMSIEPSRCAACGYALEGLPAGGVCPECAAPIPGPAAPEAGVVVEDRPCLRCGYSLRSLRLDGVCPECGTVVADSLRGNLLQYSSPEYLRKLHRGASLAEVAVAVALLTFAGLVLAGVGGINLGIIAVVGLLMPLVYAGLSLGGWWLLSSPDPSLIGQDTAERTRRTLRIALVATLALALVCTVLGIRGGSGAFAGLRGPAAQSAVAALALRVFRLGAMTALLVMMFASMRYLMFMAPRFPSDAVRKSARRVLIISAVLAILTVGPELVLLLSRTLRVFPGRLPSELAISKACASFLLAAALLAMYGNLMHRTREMLRVIRSLPRARVDPPGCS